MVFTRTCDATTLLALILRNLGFSAIPINGHMTQVTYQILSKISRDTCVTFFFLFICDLVIFMYSVVKKAWSLK